MKKLNQFKVSYQNGKELKKDLLAVKNIVDSVADNLVIDSPHLIAEAKANQQKGKIMTFEVWEEVKEVKAKKQPVKKAE